MRLASSSLICGISIKLHCVVLRISIRRALGSSAVTARQQYRCPIKHAHAIQRRTTDIPFGRATAMPMAIGANYRPSPGAQPGGSPWAAAVAGAALTAASRSTDSPSEWLHPGCPARRSRRLTAGDCRICDRPIEPRGPAEEGITAAWRGGDGPMRRVPSDTKMSFGGQRPLWVTRTTLSRTVIVPCRADVLSFAATVNETGLSPACGMVVVMVIHGTSDCALHDRRSAVDRRRYSGSFLE